MRTLTGLVLGATVAFGPTSFLAASGPTPSPLPDASPTTRGALNTSPTQQVHGKIFTDRVSVQTTDGGVALQSTCVPSVTSLGSCTAVNGNALQCVLDAGWFACQSDGGWSVLGAGAGGVASVAGTGAIGVGGTSSNPIVECAVASSGQDGCLSQTDYGTFAGKLATVGAVTPLLTDGGSIAVDPTARLNMATIFAGIIDAGIVLSPYGLMSVVDAGSVFAQSIQPVEIDAPVFNSPIELVGNCNPATTGCAALNVQNTAPSTSNKIQTWGNPSSPVATIYNNGTFDVYPANLSCNVVFANVVQDPTGSGGVTVLSERSASSVNSDFIVNTTALRTAGALQAWENQGATKTEVDPLGQVIGGIDQNSFASFQDGSGSSGHVTLTAATGMNTVIMGRLEEHCAVLADGGQPASDGGNLYFIGSDGGTCYEYGGKHGDVTFISVAPGRRQGWLAEFNNPRLSPAEVAAIDYNGAFVEQSSNDLSKFGIYAHLVQTSLGQFYEGQFESALEYSFGNSTNERHYFVQGPANPDGGATFDFFGPSGTWRQLPYADDISRGVVTNFVDAGIILTEAVAAPANNESLTLTGNLLTPSSFGNIILNSANALSGFDKLVAIQNSGVEVDAFGADGTIYAESGNVIARQLLSDVWATPTGSGGLFAVGARAGSDPAGDLYIEGPRDPSVYGTDYGLQMVEGITQFPVFGVTVAGQVYGGSQYAPSAFKVAAGAGSGFVALQAADSNYLLLQGLLGEDTNAINPDGGKPVLDGGAWVGQLSDGGTFYYYAGLHGSVVINDGNAKQGGWTFQVANQPDGGNGLEESFFVDSFLGFGIFNAVERPNFPGAGVNVPTTVGQYFYGTLDSTQRYASDTHQWYYWNGTEYREYVTVGDSGVVSFPTLAASTIETSPTNTTFNFLSGLPAASSFSDWVFSSVNTRTGNEPMLAVQNNGSSIFAVDTGGNAFTSGGMTTPVIDAGVILLNGVPIGSGGGGLSIVRAVAPLASDGGTISIDPTGTMSIATINVGVIDAGSILLNGMPIVLPMVFGDFQTSGIATTGQDFAGYWNFAHDFTISGATISKNLAITCDAETGAGVGGTTGVVMKLGTGTGSCTCNLGSCGSISANNHSTCHCTTTGTVTDMFVSFDTSTDCATRPSGMFCKVYGSTTVP